MTDQANSRFSFAELYDRIPSSVDDLDNAARNCVETGGRLTDAAMTAAQRGAEQSGNWTRDTVESFRTLAEPKDHPSAYFDAVTRFAADSAQTASTHMSAFAGIAKSLHSESMDILLGTRVKPSAGNTKAATKANRSND